ncbi:glutaredoxin 2 [Shewanella sp. NFH-SH190041]|uniref:glutaredoxin 2 n=1 Tax=Shewanella sp. NFH-SH190041 TaxID=2950245 RepID=UPI0021C3E19C|nr:glutaredoxin 2 [Shewanella sp. NFH-SH190041]BDM65460.1 glutaredoxin 2 [Shewanella sp. NFH-SH190041]
MKLFVFDHCPYCIKAMMVAGWKALPVEWVYLQNHDVNARIEKVGANLVPILQKPDGSYMAESLDIAAYLDNLTGQPQLQPGVHEQQINRWSQQARQFGAPLLYPRWMEIKLPEFQCDEARAWFTKNKSASIGMSFPAALAQTPTLLAGLNQQLATIDWLVLPSERENRLSYDDINFFPTLRNYTVIKGIEFPPQVRRYIDEVAALTGIELYDNQAC